MSESKLESKHNISIVMLENLFSMYGISDESHLYKYLYIKCSVNMGKKKVSELELLRFVIDELNLTIYDDKGFYLLYKGEKHSLHEISTEFLDNLVFRANMFEEVNTEEELDTVFRKGYAKAAKYRGLSDYKDYIKYNRLLVLNELYNVKDTSPLEIAGFENGANYNPFKRSLEESLEASLAANRFLGSQTTAHVSEEDVESFIVENIDIVEEGMRSIDRQVNVSGGVVDILAMDKDDNICIIEVKIEHDKSIIWQALHYPKEIRKKWPRRNIRMITVSPSYNKHVLEKLKEIDNVETKGYSIKVVLNKIEELIIYEVW